MAGRLGIQKQGAVLGLERANERFRLRVVPGSIQGIRHPGLVLQQQLGCPAIPGEHSVQLRDEVQWTAGPTSGGEVGVEGGELSAYRAACYEYQQLNRRGPPEVVEGGDRCLAVES